MFVICLKKYSEGEEIEDYTFSTQIYPCSPSTKHPVGDPDKFHTPERMFKWHCSANKNPGVPCQVRLEVYNSVTNKWELAKKETYEPTRD